MVRYIWRLYFGKKQVCAALQLRWSVSHHEHLCWSGKIKSSDEKVSSCTLSCNLPCNLPSLQMVKRNFISQEISFLIGNFISQEISIFCPKIKFLKVLKKMLQGRIFHGSLVKEGCEKENWCLISSALSSALSSELQLFVVWSS